MSKLECLSPNSKTVTIYIIELTDGVAIRLLRFQPKGDYCKPSILFIPGFLSLVEHWIVLIDNLVKRGYTLYVMETREKSTSTATEKSKFTGERYIKDLQECIIQTNISKPFILMGSSMGAGMIISYLVRNKTNGFPLPSKAILLEAVYDTSTIRRAITVAKLPKRVFSMIKTISVKTAPLLLKEAKKHPTKYAHFIEAISKADAGKMKVCLINFKDANLKPYLSSVAIPTLVVADSIDKIHSAEQSIRIAKLVQKGHYEVHPMDEDVNLEELSEIIASFVGSEV